MINFPYILTISSEKGGVGKTTLATNLAIYLKAIRNDLPVTIFSFDNHFTIDRMFELKGQDVRGSVKDMLEGAKGSDLLHVGKYGVRFIPSSNHLDRLYASFKGPMALCRMMAESGLSGIVIIDTRPDLNILTQNALYAADRVLIPVKDMPSLENCKHIFELFDQRGIDKKSLALIPCLIDSRIKYEGLFSDQRTLLRAFAINRGYRCMDTYISKSPKVESLNTNPDGKIYPILTHAKGTEVNAQFIELAQDILASYDATPEPRSYLYSLWLNEQEDKKKQSFLARLEGIPGHCIICGNQFGAGNPKGFYYETSDKASRGFLHTDCFAGLLCSTIYNLQPDSQPYQLSLQVMLESAKSTASAFMPEKNSDGEYLLRFMQFDQTNSLCLDKNLHLEGFQEGRLDGIKDRLYLLLNESLAGYGGDLRDCWLTVHPVDENMPESVLQEPAYKNIQSLHKTIASIMASDN